MNEHRDIFRLHDLLDGSLSRSEEAALRESLQQDDRLRAELRELEAVRDLLSRSLDLEEPADLRVGILAAVRADRARRARMFRLPGWFENALVLSGAATLAGLVTFGRALGGDWAAPWLGRLSVGAVEALGLAKTAAVGTQGSLAQMDWVVGVLRTLSNAGWTVVGSSSDVILVGAIVAALLAGSCWMLLRHGRRGLSGGMGHAHLLA
ncbi:MAG: hypothetical protein DHS20C21_24130 [Gemmatimonadota bacterium]|nr:MAG: hypothetical protein DHS20C21_24130 [Gemmatimonadota bacterium]